jgi:S-DNA-T family DNA segregation ATPase FtsK/SpoIIIE
MTDKGDVWEEAPEAVWTFAKWCGRGAKNNPRRTAQGVAAVAVLVLVGWTVLQGVTGFVLVAFGLVGFAGWWVVRPASGDAPPAPVAGRLALMPGALLAPARPLPPPLAVPSPYELLAVPVGQILNVVTDPQTGQQSDQPTGEQWTLPLWGHHTLAAGITGSGKSGIIWSLMHGLGHAIQCGQVRVYAIDPKGGREVGMGLPLFEKFACGRTWAQQAAAMLDELVGEMFALNEAEFGANRMHVPTPSEPLRLILFDELAAVNHNDKKARDALLAPLEHLMEQGRAAAFNVFAAIQDPRVETIPFRSKFSQFIGLRLPFTIVDPMFGKGAYDRGMCCDQISPKRPGTAFVFNDESVPVKVRSYWHDDAAVRMMAQRYKRAV